MILKTIEGILSVIQHQNRFRLTREEYQLS